MIVLDESLDVEVKKIIEENHETVEKLSEIKLPVPSCLFNIFFVNKENIGTVQKLIHNQKNAYLFIFWDGGSLSGLDENELEFFTFINRSLSINGSLAMY